MKLQSAISNFLFFKEEKRTHYVQIEKRLEELHPQAKGIITYPQLVTCFEELYGQRELAEKEVKNIFAQTVTPSKTKKLEEVRFDYGLLLKAAIDRLEYDITNNKLKNAFELFDMDGNGTISLEEIQYLLSGITGTLDRSHSTQDVVEVVVNKFGCASDGELHFTHFKQIMYSLFLYSRTY